MLQVARLAPDMLGDAARLVGEFVTSNLNSDGGFADRVGASDLYYTVFGIECMIALQQDLPKQRIAAFLDTFGDGEALDLVHLCCLARCRTGLGDTTHATLPRIAQRIGQHEPKSVYDAFMIHAAYQDIGVESRTPERFATFLRERATGDGGYTNDADIQLANTPATAAAIALQHALELPHDPRSGDFLLRCSHPEGGFYAMPAAPIPDLLSTAVALHALAILKRDIDPIRERTLDFIDTLWTSTGGFYGNWAEEEGDLDIEYTWYGLLALGHLSV